MVKLNRTLGVFFCKDEAEALNEMIQRMDVEEESNHLHERHYAAMKTFLTKADVLDWSTEDPRRANVSTCHSFILKDNCSIYHRKRPLKLRYYKLVKKEIEKMLRAEIVALVSSAWSLLV